MPAPLPAHTVGAALAGAALSGAVSLRTATTRVSTGPSGCLHPTPVPGFGPKQTEVRGNLSIDSAGLGAKQHCTERLGHKAERQRGPMPTHKRFLSASRRALTQPLTGSPWRRKLSRRSRGSAKASSVVPGWLPAHAPFQHHPSAHGEAMPSSVDQDRMGWDGRGWDTHPSASPATSQGTRSTHNDGQGERQEKGKQRAAAMLAAAGRQHCAGLIPAFVYFHRIGQKMTANKLPASDLLLPCPLKLN